MTRFGQSVKVLTDALKRLGMFGEWYLASVDDLSPIFNDFRRISAQGACGISTALTLKRSNRDLLKEKARQAEAEGIFS